MRTAFMKDNGEWRSDGNDIFQLALFLRDDRLYFGPAEKA